MLIEETLKAKTERDLNWQMDNYADYYPYFGYGTNFSPISAIGNSAGGVSHYQVTVYRSSHCD